MNRPDSYRWPLILIVAGLSLIAGRRRIETWLVNLVEVREIRIDGEGA